MVFSSQEERDRWYQDWPDFLRLPNVKQGPRTRIEDAVAVKMHGGVVQTSEGPFVSPPNAVTDWYEVEVDSIEAAIDTAARIPHLACGFVVEIRRLQNFRHPSAPRRRVDR